MSVVITYTRGKHRGKYVKESQGNPYWDEVSIEDATGYKDFNEAYKKINQLCAKVGAELYLKPVQTE